MIAAIYARASTGKQGDTIQHQVSMVKEWGERMNEDIKFYDEYIFEDNDESSYQRPLLERPAMKRMIDVIEGEDVDIIFFKGVSRFARDSGEAITTLNRLIRKGVRVVSVEEMYDSKVSDPTFFQIYAVLAESESRKTSIRVSLGNKEKARKGLWVPAKTPYGYVRVKELPDEDLKQELQNQGLHPHKLYPHPKESTVVKKIFDLFIDARIGKVGIAEMLINLGYRTRNGYRWTDNEVHRILVNRAHVGEVNYGMTQRRVVELKGGETVKRDVQVSDDKHIKVNNAHPKIVSIEKFNKAQKIIEERRPKKMLNGGNFNNARHPLVGILKCGTCGSNTICQSRTMKLSSGEKKIYRYYVCSAVQRGGRAACPQKNMPASELEEHIYDTIKSRILSVDIESMMNKYATFDPNRKINEDMDLIDSRITSLEDKSLALLENRDIYDTETFRNMNMKIKGEITGLRNQKKELERELKFSESIVTQDDLRKELNEFVTLDLNDQVNARRVFSKWINKVEVKDNKVYIEQKFKI